MGKLKLLIVLLVIGVGAGAYYKFSNKNVAKLDSRWAQSDDSSTLEVDHSLWQEVLDDYVIPDETTGVNLFDYAGLLDDGRETLDEYVASLVQLNPLTLNSQEQKAYWINLYNALTVQLILNEHPVTSITKLGQSATDFGPWDDPVTQVNQIELTLNDIEHRIIRPLYNDYRIHFAVNCASIGCPDLYTETFNADSLDDQLDQATRDYLAHPRGINIQGDELVLSSLFKWYRDDFGADQDAMLATLKQHTDEQTASWLESYQGTPSYHYDWSINGYCQVDSSCGQ